MCGIAGWAGQPLPEPDRLCAKLQQCLSHRGPDAQGYWVACDGTAGLAHTRLAVIDLDERSNQPMRSRDGRLIVYNGEIYNYRELRLELESAGAHFVTDSDTEVILTGYELRGTKWLAKLRGMYAIAIWDPELRELILARDPLGIKPVYYSLTNGRIAFASELRALIATGMVGLTEDVGAIFEFLRWGSFQQPQTPLQDVRALQAGQVLRWRAGTVTSDTIHHDWWPDGSADSPSDPEFLRSAVETSVGKHLASDVPVGLFLSAGLDSSVIGLVMSRLQPKGTAKAFTLGFPESAANEIPEARAWAASLGLSHVAWSPSDTEVSGLAESYFQNMDLPGIDGFNTFCIASLAAREGCKVVLSGVGGDELFGGYPSFRRLPQMMRWHGWLRNLPGTAWAMDEAAQWCRQPRCARLAEWIANPRSWESTYAAFRGIYNSREARLIMAELGHADLGDEMGMDRSSNLPDAHLDKVAFLEISRYLRNQLLRDSDSFSMACGVELRLPLVDVQLYRHVLAIDSAWRCRPGKRALIDAFSELPSWLTKRQKTGFSLPFDRWFRTALAPLSQGLPDQLEKYMSSWYRRMCLLSLWQWRRSNLGI